MSVVTDRPVLMSPPESGSVTVDSTPVALEAKVTDGTPIEITPENRSPISSKRGDLGHKLAACMRPKSIAVVGATERAGTVGRTVFENLTDHYGTEHKPFTLYPVNPTRPSVLGVTAYKCVSDIPDAIDMAVIVVPAKSVPAVVEDCGHKGVHVVAVLAAGFKEIGPEGAKLEQEIVEMCAKYDMRLIGPNCLGVMNPHHMMNATFAADPAPKGSIAFVSQSGAMCTACLDWARTYNVGFSAFISIGSMADANWADLIVYLGSDPHTRAIMIYMESIGDAEAFMQAAKGVTEKKPIIIIKAGRTASAAVAAVSHTGSLVGSHDAFLAAMRRVGVLTVESIQELNDCALLMDKQPRPLKMGVTIITNAGGPGVLTTDAAELAGIAANDLPDDLRDKLDAFLPSAWSRHNPVDVLGDAGAETYAKTLSTVLENSDHTGAIVVVLSPQSVTEPTGTARRVVETYSEWRKKNPTKIMPIVCAWMGGKAVTEGMLQLNKGGVPCFYHPDNAVKALGTMFAQVQAVDAIRGLPLVPVCKEIVRDTARALAIIKKAREENRLILSESESKAILKAYFIKVAESVLCHSEEECARACADTGFPCVIKLHSDIITHKSDVGGVKLNINSEEAAKEAYSTIFTTIQKINPAAFQGVSVQPMLDLAKGTELVFGSFTDNQFGPMCLFGTGGTYVEIFKDTTLGVPPLTSYEAKLMIDRTKISSALAGGHGDRFKPCDMSELRQTLVRFSHMVYELYDEIAECDVNPMLALSDRIIALDARIVLHDRNAENKPCRPCLTPPGKTYFHEAIF